ncbi:unnamed protein product [Spirodela intermedia]|uniref:Uncharacterized protein n=1 Tax=Spirodela intermedia TaxID=51605 RepID=A0A7I8LFF9_SPIIN|nr:unnamed protein product [Spirodela intermedia]
MVDPGGRIIRRAPTRELSVGVWIQSGWCYRDRLKGVTPRVLAVEPWSQRPSPVIQVRGTAGETRERSARTAMPLEGKENRPPVTALWRARSKKSHLPICYLRKPLKDITTLAMGKRSVSLRSAARHRGAPRSPLSSPSPSSFRRIPREIVNKDAR